MILNEFLKKFRVKEWDVLMISDGSGSSSGLPIGWSVVIIDRFSGVRKLIVGGQTDGTVNQAELLPFLAGFKYYEKMIRNDRTKGVRAHLFSDSEYTVNCGSLAYKRDAHADLWAAVDYYITKLGYSIFWHWIARDRYEVQKLADEFSKKGRQQMKSLDIYVATPYEVLPSSLNG